MFYGNLIDPHAHTSTLREIGSVIGLVLFCIAAFVVPAIITGI